MQNCCAIAAATNSEINAHADVGIGDVTVNAGKGHLPISGGGGLLETIGRALDAAVHGGDSVGAGASIGPNRNYSAGGANVVPFPMVNPYRPAVKTGAPITALTAFPKRFTSEVEVDSSGIPDDEQAGFSGLGSLGLSLAPYEDVYQSSSPTKLQTILGTIQATLPATIQALRATPTNIYPSQTYNPYSTSGSVYPDMGRAGAGADIGASAGAAVGNVGDTISGIVARHPFLVLGAGAALLLLFMNPPRRR